MFDPYLVGLNSSHRNSLQASSQGPHTSQLKDGETYAWYAGWPWREGVVFVDGLNATKGNWMRYVNGARCEMHFVSVYN